MHRRGVLRIWNRAKLKLTIACLAALGTLAVGAAGASATPYIDVCTGLGNPALCSNGFSQVFDVAVDNSSNPGTAGDVYVTDIPGTVSRYTALGAPAPFSGTDATHISGNQITEYGAAIGVGVEYATGDFFVSYRPASGNVLNKFSPTGELIASFPLAGFTEDAGVAVDNSAGPSKGDIYVTDAASNTVDKLNSTGTVIGTITSGVATPYGVATDAHGHVYVLNFGNAVRQYSESGAFEKVINSEAPQAVATYPSTGDIFVAEGTNAQIQPYTEAGVALTPFGHEDPVFGGFTSGLGVSGTTHYVYVSDLVRGHATIFAEEAPAPSAPVTGTPATEITGHTAKLHGTVNPGGPAQTAYHFGYNTNGTCEGEGSNTTTPGEPAIRNNEAVESEATGLTPKTVYTFCLVATNPFGATPGSAQTFETTAAKPAVEEAVVVERATTTVKVSAKINPGGAATTCEVQYGTTTAYGSIAPCSVAGTGIVGVPVSAELTGLAANTEYHFRFVANNVEGTTEGSDVVVTTKPLVEAETGAASPIGSETATLHGIVSTGEEPGRYFFEYGTTISYGSKTAVLEVSGEGAHPVSIQVTGLVPKTGYHYRLVATPKNEPAVEIQGADATFETSAAKPAIVEEFSENENRHSVSLGAEINPKNSEATYFFEYEEATKFEVTHTYGRATQHQTLAAGTEAVEVGPEAVTELNPGTTYNYRVVAENGAGRVEGPDETFTTAAPQLAFEEVETETKLPPLVSQTKATITGLINPNGLQTNYILEVGTEVEGKIVYTPSFGVVGSGNEGVPLVFTLTNLLPGTTYHYRFGAQNEDGTVFGPDHSFKTGSFPSGITLPGPVQIIPTPPQPIEKIEGTHIKTRAEKYKEAVKLCKKKPKKKRGACMRRAKKNFGPVKKKGKKK
jgi:hypothetical protein